MITLFVAMIVFFVLSAWFHNDIIRWAHSSGEERDMYQTEWHLIDFTIKGMIVLNVGFLLKLPMMKFGHLLLIAGFVHYVVFDTLLNIFRGLNPDYIGEYSPSDRLFRYLKLPGWLLKAVSLIASIILIYLF